MSVASRSGSIVDLLADMDEKCGIVDLFVGHPMHALYMVCHLREHLIIILRDNDRVTIRPHVPAAEFACHGASPSEKPGDMDNGGPGIVIYPDNLLHNDVAMSGARNVSAPVR